MYSVGLCEAQGRHRIDLGCKALSDEQLPVRCITKFVEKQQLFIDLA